MSDTFETTTLVEGELPSYMADLPEARPHIHETRRFPLGFAWGAATSSHQVEGGNDNDWTEWEKIPGKILDGTNTASACDHFNRYEEDFDLAKSLGHNAHRLSLEWSRIEPEEGRFDMDAVMHYRRVIKSLKERNMRVFLTVWHFSLPKWFAARGGWLAKDAPELFTRYAKFVAEEYGDLVDVWTTINEPMVYLSMSHIIGAWPPGNNNVIKAGRIFFAVAKSHRLAYREMHAVLDSPEHKAEIGIAKNVTSFVPYRQYNPLDNAYVWVADLFYNRMFFSFTRKTHDYIGINFYFYYRVKCVPRRPNQFFFEVHTENREVSDLGWEINPQGLFGVLMSMNRYGLPIYVTEHGLACADDGKRPRAIVSAVKEVFHAIRAGVDVRGYLHWSLLDNFEWDKGLSPRFGLVAIDYATQKRTPRRSAYVYKEICEANGLPHHLLRFAGHGVRW